MTWSLFTMPALVVAGVAAAVGSWWLLADWLLDHVSLPCRGVASRIREW
jgi:hypothetical protein